MEFDSGATGDIESSRTSPYGFDIGCEIIGTEGAIQIPSIRSREALLLNASGRHELGPNFPPSMVESYKAEIIQFINSIQQRSPSACSEEDGKAALATAIAATESFKIGQAFQVDGTSLVQK
ncbi:Gfo/Idh/MocA family oxidoreductase [Domibacillus tundrae]|uniref:Gfo/Idh/MocA family oxidoreductase n=1 Tax=Domibacillus tundrae TaxID=1587527 RepID=UPI00069880C1